MVSVLQTSEWGGWNPRGKRASGADRAAAEGAGGRSEAPRSRRGALSDGRDQAEAAQGRDAMKLSPGAAAGCSCGAVAEPRSGRGRRRSRPERSASSWAARGRGWDGRAARETLRGCQLCRKPSGGSHSPPLLAPVHHLRGR